MEVEEGVKEKMEVEEGVKEEVQEEEVQEEEEEEEEEEKDEEEEEEEKPTRQMMNEQAARTSTLRARTAFRVHSRDVRVQRSQRVLKGRGAVGGLWSSASPGLRVRR
eukprot:2589215-Rhodomonas_salina.1